MPKLNQVLAIEKGTGQKAFRHITDAYKTVSSRTQLFSGVARTYSALNEDDPDTFPDETTPVQLRAEELLRDVLRLKGTHWDVVATKDEGNTKARADVVVGTTTVLEDVPVTTLLFLEKQLTDLRTFVAALPTLPISEQWQWDAGQGIHRTEPSQKNRTKKVPKNHVRAPATDKHPAQVDVYHEDVPVGRWTTVAFSGAFEPARATTILDRIDALLQGVQKAREEANSREVEDIHIGDAITAYLVD
jgi:hypothetical protein